MENTMNSPKESALVRVGMGIRWAAEMVMAIPCAFFCYAYMAAQAIWGVFCILVFVFMAWLWGERLLWLAGLMFAVLLVVAAPTPNAHAMAVSDATSYTYYVEQIKKQSETIEHLTEQISELQNIVKMSTEIRDQLMGAFDHAKGLLDDMAHFKKRVEQDPLVLGEFAERWFSSDKDLKGKNGYVDVEKLLYKTFIDLTDPNTDELEAYYRTRDLRQRSIHASLVDAGDLLDQMESKSERLEYLYGILKDNLKNPSLKSAQDLTSLVCIEILKDLDEMLRLQSKFFTAQNLMIYQGVSDETTEANKVKSEAETTKSAESRNEVFINMIQNDLNNFGNI